MRWAICCLLTTILITLLFESVGAQGFPSISIGIEETTDTEQVAIGLQILFLLTVLTMAPAILLMTTSFVRIVVVLSFVRHAMGTQQMPPNQIIIGLAMFLTFFIMSPVFQEINSQAIQPYLNKNIDEKKALKLAAEPMREFMFSQVNEKDLKLMFEIAKKKQPENKEDIGMLTLVPSFMLSELKKAFQIGFMLFVPFLVVDMIVASVLMSMGMLMLPPIIISLPFKILLFVLVDGWHLVVGSVVQSFY